MAVQIREGIHWVGALDPDIRVFDVIMAAPHGTTYNAYLVEGTEKRALIETVKAGFEPQLFSRLGEVIEPWSVDYVVVNHTEPDHSGSLAQVLQELGSPQVVCSKSAKLFVSALLNQDVSPLLVGTGDTLDLGGKTLEFVHAPFLHWPDTMFTYVPEDRALFPCDFLGAHFCDERMFNDLVESYDYQFEYYFNVILRPFKPHVLKALDALAAREIEVIGPSHGPILRTDLDTYLEKYRLWASALPAAQSDLLLVLYASSYGNTRKLAQEIAHGAEAKGARVSVVDLSGADLGTLLGDIESCGALAVGSLTVNGDAVKPVWDLLSSLATLEMRGRPAAAFGSYAWSGEASRLIHQRLADLKMKPVADPVRANLTVDATNLAAARELGAKLAEAMGL